MKNARGAVLMTAVCLLMLFSSITAFSKPRVTFVELGATWCTPCKLMQPVMRSLENRYGEQLKVIFYNVSSDKERSYAKQYGIRLIPTQVFLDESGKEFFRHEGFFPEAEIDKLLKQRGMTAAN
jgi:thioredoxin 1